MIHAEYHFLGRFWRKADSSQMFHEQKEEMRGPWLADELGRPLRLRTSARCRKVGCRRFKVQQPPWGFARRE